MKGQPSKPDARPSSSAQAPAAKRAHANCESKNETAKRSNSGNARKHALVSRSKLRRTRGCVQIRGLEPKPGREAVPSKGTGEEDATARARVSRPVQEQGKERSADRRNLSSDFAVDRGMAISAGAKRSLRSSHKDRTRTGPNRPTRAGL